MSALQTKLVLLRRACNKVGKTFGKAERRRKNKRFHSSTRVLLIIVSLCLSKSTALTGTSLDVKMKKLFLQTYAAILHDMKIECDLMLGLQNTQAHVRHSDHRSAVLGPGQCVWGPRTLCGGPWTICGLPGRFVGPLDGVLGPRTVCVGPWTVWAPRTVYGPRGLCGPPRRCVGPADGV